MSTMTKASIYIFLSVFVIGVCTVFFTAVQIPLYAEAEEITYSEVLDDLKKDSSFHASNYPENKTDYSLNVIQIAESVNKELFVYVYQPSGQNKKLTASSINISLTINDSIRFYNYKLELIQTALFIKNTLHNLLSAK